MPQTQSAQEIVSQTGFWDKPEKEQVSSLASVNSNFKNAPPEVQKKVLATARSKFGVKPGQPPSPPSTPPPSNVGPPKSTSKPAEPPVPGMGKLGALPGPPEPRKPALPWEMSFQQPSQYAREHPADIPQSILDKTTHGVGQLAQGIEGMTSDTTKEKFRAAHKIVEGTMDAATPIMMGAAATNPLTFAKVATTASVSQSVVTDSLKGMGLPEEYAQVAGDLAGLIVGAKAYNRAKIKAQIEPILRERLLKLKQGEMGKGETFTRGEESVKVGGKEFPVTERTNASHAEKAVDARSKSGKPSPPPLAAEPKTPAAIERRIGELQDQLNEKGISAKSRSAAEAEIKRLQQAHPDTKGTEKIVEGFRAKKPLQLPGPPDPSGLSGQPDIPIEKQLELAKQQPPEVVQNFISKMQDGFLRKLDGVNVNELAPEKKAAVMDEFRKMQEYLAPFEELVKGKSAAPATPAAQPPGPPPPSNVGPPEVKPPAAAAPSEPAPTSPAPPPDPPSAPPAAAAEPVKPIPEPPAKPTGTTVKKKSAVPPKKTAKPAAPAPKAKPGQPPVPPPTEISEGIVKGLTAKGIPKSLFVEVPGVGLKWTKKIGGQGDLETQVLDVIRQCQAKGYKTVTIQPGNTLGKPYGEPISFQANPADE